MARFAKSKIGFKFHRKLSQNWDETISASSRRRLMAKRKHGTTINLVHESLQAVFVRSPNRPVGLCSRILATIFSQFVVICFRALKESWYSDKLVLAWHYASKSQKIPNVLNFRIEFSSYHPIVLVETKHETRFQSFNFNSHLFMAFWISFSL